VAEVELDARSAPAVRHGGIVDRAFSWLESLPGTAVPWIIGAAVLLGLAGHLVSWLSGETPIGEPRLRAPLSAAVPGG
jgi:hypothetical protein